MDAEFVAEGGYYKVKYVENVSLNRGVVRFAIMDDEAKAKAYLTP